MNTRALGLILSILSLWLLCLRVIVPILVDDVGEVGRYTDLLMSPVSPLFLVLAMAFGGALMVFGTSDSILLVRRRTVEVAGNVDRPALALSPLAQAAAVALNDRLTRFRGLPPEAVSAEAMIEFDAIVAKHLPRLRDAHDDARLTVPGGSADADSLDHDYAASLDRLTATVDRLLENCSDAARGRFAVEHRFIELRHPDETIPI